ncbi:hypothetical protein NHH03_10215 [Stieleria sp. TO1_6]|uniref:hypothetical protein n=1 Tax=Stieleria tagensis TaxID=2956795 RepID=UPI00209B7722|nr:hypothetical protein [Stieleria tagensis]MCO8122113.1 hypothetical protein [Stieleria tagensis]
MAKYYVQSGTLRTTVEAESSRKAALWAVHQAMQQVLPVDDNDQTTPTSKTESAAAAGVRVMDQVVRVSQLGFDAGDTRTLSTMDVVREWNDMFSALDRLQRMLHEGVTAA